MRPELRKGARPIFTISVLRPGTVNAEGPGLRSESARRGDEGGSDSESAGQTLRRRRAFARTPCGDHRHFAPPHTEAPDTHGCRRCAAAMTGICVLAARSKPSDPSGSSAGRPAPPDPAAPQRCHRPFLRRRRPRLCRPRLRRLRHRRRSRRRRPNPHPRPRCRRPGGRRSDHQIHSPPQSPQLLPAAAARPPGSLLLRGRPACSRPPLPLLQLPPQQLTASVQEDQWASGASGRPGILRLC